MTEFRVCARLEELSPGEVIGVTVDGIDIAIARDSAGTVHAIGDVCTHERVNLSDGDINGDALECWKHGSQFSLLTGAPRQLPATKPVPVYPVHIDSESGDISVSLTPQLSS